MDYVIKSISRKGRFHDLNEDSFVVYEDYMVIADGMGGESCGDVASNLAIHAISKTLNAHLSKMVSDNDIQRLSLEAILKADYEILRYVQDHPESFGMGTTVVLLILKGARCYVTWCGDSRCYVYSGNSLRSITKDHSYVQELIDRREISIEDSFFHPDNNLITKYIGGGVDVCIPEFISFELNRNSIIVLCSDGLSGYCTNGDIEYEISVSRPEELTLRLLDLAIKNGSGDDITIITLTPSKKHHSIWSWFKRKKDLF